MNKIHDSFKNENYLIGSTKFIAQNLNLTKIKLNNNNRNFIDQFGRILILHGLNLSGLNKLPINLNGTHELINKDSIEISFIGRPFTILEAHQHFTRFQQWGLTFIRLVITWEALEPESPGLYDYKYMDYLKELIELMPKYGLVAFVDCHQDVFSRHTGGSGAPLWTLELLGFDSNELKSTGSAHNHNSNLDSTDPLPSVWPSGYCKLAPATMATVFWGGNTFAPKRKVNRTLHKSGKVNSLDGSDQVGVQHFLQTSMIEAFGTLSDRLKGCEALIGFELYNEPHRGYIELLSPYSWDFNTDLAIGYFPSPLQSWALGSGHSVLIDSYAPSFPVTAKTHHVLFSPRKKVWLPNSSCIWKDESVWSWREGKGEGAQGEAVILRADYFKKHPVTGETVEWYRDFYWPFCNAFSERIKSSNSELLSLVGPIPNEFCPPWPTALQPSNLVYTPHFYDLQALFSKQLGFMTANVQGLSRGMFFLKGLYFGRSGLKKNYELQIRNIIEAGYKSIGEVPCIVSETGVPFDMNKGSAFVTGNFKYQERMMDGICSALEENFVGYNLWNYNHLNSNEYGDGWNSENFSIFSSSDITTEALEEAGKKGEMERLNVGARVIDAFERPYACKISGIPIHTQFDMNTLAFSLKFTNPMAPNSNTTPKYDQSKASTKNPPLEGESIRCRETEIYLPRRRYGNLGDRLQVFIGEEEGSSWEYVEERQTLYFLHTNCTPGFTHSIEILVKQEGKRWLDKEVILGIILLLFSIYYAKISLTSI